jgi:O-antigen/teichoic acid export membrane protein
MPPEAASTQRPGLPDVPKAQGEPAASAAPPAAGARRVARNAIIPFAAGLLARLMTWVLAAVMARRLGPAGSGQYNFAVSLWLYASIVADFGLGTWLTREIARAPGPDQARRALRETLGVRLLLSTVAVPVLAGVAGIYAAFGADWRIVATAALLGLGLIPGSLSAAGTALFNAHERMTFPALVQLISAALTVIAGCGVLLLGHGIVALGWVSLAVNVVTAMIFALACARQFFPLSVAIAPRRQLRLAQDALPLMLNNLLNNVFFRVDVQVLQAKGSAVVGYYTNAYKVIDAAGAVPSSFVLALFPLLSRRAAPLVQAGEAGQHGAGDAAEGLAAVYRLALKLLLAVAFPAAILVSFGAADLTRWLWGPAFLPHSAIALRILIWFLPLSFFNGLTQYVLIALGLQRRITPAFAAAALFNLAANLILIPRFSYVAAAAVTIASEVVLLVPFLLAVRGHVALRPLLGAALRLLPPAAIMGLAVLGTAAWSRPAAVVAGAGSYVAALWLTGTFAPAERRMLAGLVPDRYRRAARAAR